MFYRISISQEAEFSHARTIRLLKLKILYVLFQEKQSLLCAICECNIPGVAEQFRIKKKKLSGEECRELQEMEVLEGGSAVGYCSDIKCNFVNGKQVHFTH